MFKLKQLLIFLLFFLCGINIFAASNAKMQKDINTIINQANLPATIGIRIQSMSNGQTLYLKNPTNLYVPASNLKLFTAAAALLYLGPDYQLQTAIYSDAKTISNGVLQGNLYLKFNGDPDLTSDQLNNLIAAFKQANHLTAIQGNVYIDNSAYHDKRYAPGWMWDELNFCYAAPIEPIMINHNCFNATLTAAQHNGEPAVITSTTAALTPIKNNTVTTEATKSCAPDLKSLGDNNYLLAGCVPAQSQPIILQIAIRDPNLYAQKLVAQLLQSNSIQLQGKIENAVTPVDLKPLAVQNSKPLAELITEMLKNSDNQIANSLLMILGENYYHQPATWKNGVAAMRAILAQQAGIDFTESSMVDGAGISRYDMITPKQVSKLLYFMYHDPKVATVFINALPIAGKDGTLAGRMREQNIRGELHAKTGTMTGVSSLSGYVVTADKKTLSFTILINNFLANNINQAEKLEDKIGEYLAGR